MLLLALLSVVISIVGFFGGRKIRLELMFWNFWGMLVLLGPLLGLGAAALFTNMLLRLASRHQWGHANFSGLRRRFCQPGTFDNKCMPPISVANEPSKLSEWCQLEFQSTDCASIFMAAFSDACEYLDSLTNLTGALAISAVFFMGVCMMACVRIITVPVMMQSLVALIHFIQLIPALVGIILGKINLEQDSLELAPIKIGVLQLLMGSFQLVLLLFGFFAARWKNRKMLGVHIIFSIAVLVCLGIISCASFTYGSHLVEKYENASDAEIESEACRSKVTGCCCCDVGRCPEWAAEDLIAANQSDFYFSGLFSVISMSYVLCNIFTCHIVRENLRGYKTDYI